MQDKDIRRLFQKAEIQVCPEQKRILKMYEYLQNEIDKNENKKQRKRTEISLRDILWQQFRLIDKTYVIVYIMAVFAGFALMVFFAVCRNREKCCDNGKYDNFWLFEHAFCLGD